MFIKLNNNKEILKMVQIHCENLRMTKPDSAKVGLKTTLSMKSDYGLKLESILIDTSLQLNENIALNDSVFCVVVDFFENFTSSDLWLEQIETNINDALEKQKHSNKKVG